MPSHKEFYDAISNISVNADTLNLNTDQVESKLDTATGLLTTLSADTALIKADLANGVLADLRDGSGNPITSTVSGSKRSLDVTANVSIPSGLDANIRDGSGNALTSSARGAERALSVQIVDGSGAQITSFNGGTVTANAGTGTFAVSASSLPLPTGASTSANQTTANTSLSSIDGKLPSSLSGDRLKVDGSGVVQPIKTSNGSVTVTTGTTSGTASTSSQALASNGSRKYLLIQNISDTDMYFNFGASATTSNLLAVKNGGGLVFESGFCPTDEVNVICSGTSKAYYILSA